MSYNIVHGNNPRPELESGWYWVDVDCIGIWEPARYFKGGDGDLGLWTYNGGEITAFENKIDWNIDTRRIVRGE